MLSEVSQTEEDKYCMISVLCVILKSEAQKKRSELGLREAGGGWRGNWMKAVKWCKHRNTRDIIHSMMSAAHTTVSHGGKWFREYILRVLITREKHPPPRPGISMR